ncbi:hypothetical protein SAMN04488034_103106 [Salinimicrobium catena]|uniref:Uncharacterized protein n=1 Tax=Salinimicrobium catena TaxID=390640 RepID=A0A1H5MVM3_9FLAO|nr:hypothetical protein [Salinimicrobium catena]SDL29638.1 hypothetical protein SAMN04488140_103106 [Salinimicrobium catena]SEE92797.1 hypothetical protein SAMN04488034_103106 [Salinimicrobium catena]
MKENVKEHVLRIFQDKVCSMPQLNSEKEIKIFLQLQKYNLIYVTPEGAITITKKGKAALKFGVEKYIVLERFEEKLLKDAMNREIERKWIYFAAIPLILILSIGLLYLQLEIN